MRERKDVLNWSRGAAELGWSRWMTAMSAYPLSEGLVTV